MVRPRQKHSIYLWSFFQNSAVSLLPTFRRLWPDFATCTKLRLIDIERSTPKFLKNTWSTCDAASAGETQLFQKLAGIGSRCLIPTRNLLIASWYKRSRWAITQLFPLRGTAVSLGVMTRSCTKSVTRLSVFLGDTSAPEGFVPATTNSTACLLPLSTWG